MKIEITVSGKTIEAYIFESNLKRLLKKEKKGVLWRAKEGTQYYKITNSGFGYCTNTEDDDIYDNGDWELGNYYQTEEEAKKEQRKQKAVMRIKRYAAEKWGEFIPNWNDHNQIKFYIYYDHKKQSFCRNSNHYIQNKSFIYFEEIEHIDEIIKKFDSDLKLIFNLTSSFI